MTVDETVTGKRREEPSVGMIETRLAALRERGETVTAYCDRCGDPVQTVLLPSDPRGTICRPCINTALGL